VDIFAVSCDTGAVSVLLRGGTRLSRFVWSLHKLNNHHRTSHQLTSAASQSTTTNQTVAAIHNFTYLAVVWLFGSAAAVQLVSRVLYRYAHHRHYPPTWPFVQLRLTSCLFAQSELSRGECRVNWWCDETEMSVSDGAIASVVNRYCMPCFFYTLHVFWSEIASFSSTSKRCHYNCFARTTANSFSDP